MRRRTITALLLSFRASSVAGESLLRGVGTGSPVAGVGDLDNEVAHGGKLSQRRLDVTNKFQMKLWYTEGIKWEYRGKHWCWQCVGQKGCNPDDEIVTQPCRDIRAQRWQAVKVSSNYVQFMTKNVLSGPDDLCVTRADENGEKYYLDECDDNNDKQLFRGFEPEEDEKFQLNPKVPYEDGRDRCVTMNHRSRANGDYNGDKIYDQKCWKAEKTETKYWEIRWIDDGGWEEEDDVDEDEYDGGDGEKGVRDISGDVDEPVGRCSGDCDSDDDCRGDLVCYERDDGDKSPVPGCTKKEGRGSSGWDYCIDKDDWKKFEDDEGDDDDDGDDDNDEEDEKGLTEANDGDVEDGEKLGHCAGDCDSGMFRTLLRFVIGLPCIITLFKIDNDARSHLRHFTQTFASFRR